MKNNIQQPLMTSFIARINSYEVERSGFSPTDTSAITNGGVEDSQLKSSFSPADTIRNMKEVSKK